MTNTKCSNCGLPITKMGVMSPTLDEKRRNQCPKCARGWMWPKGKLQKEKLIEAGYERMAGKDWKADQHIIFCEIVKNI